MASAWEGEGPEPTQKERIPPAVPILEAMPIRYTELVELNFDRDAYSKDRPLSIWRATVEQTVWSKG